MKKFSAKNSKSGREIIQIPEITQRNAFPTVNGFQRNIVRASTSDLILNDGRRIKDVEKEEKISCSSSSSSSSSSTSSSSSISSSSSSSLPKSRVKEVVVIQEVKKKEKIVKPKKKCGCETCCEKGRKIYVKAGFNHGNGTKERPYNSLALAQSDFTWKTLIVYYSNLPLDGGIVLKHGQRIIGKGLDKPIITNTNPASNNGFGIVVDAGCVCIQNLHIDNTQNSGINYDNAANINMSCLLVTRSNQFSLTTNFPNNITVNGFTGVINSAIQGQNKHDGITRLDKVIVKDNNTGGGLYDSPFAGAERKLIIRKSEFTRLRFAGAIGGSIFLATTGIVSDAVGVKTKQYVSITNTIVHDFSLNASTVPVQGVRLSAVDGAKGHYKIKNNLFYNLGDLTNDIAGAIDIFINAVTVLADVPLGLFSEIEAKISCNKFNEVGIPTVPLQSIGVVLDTTNARSKLVVKKNSFQNLFIDIADVVAGRADEEIIIKENFATALGAFFALISVPNLTDPSYLEVKALIKENEFNGGDVIGAIFVADIVPFNKAIIELEKNCIDGNYNIPVGTAAIATLGLTTGPSNVTIVGHYNNFVNYAIGVLDSFSNANYYLDKNWWGTPGAPTVLTLGTFTGVLDVDHPLCKPIRCLLTLCCGKKKQDETRNVVQSQNKFITANDHTIVKAAEITLSEKDQLVQDNDIIGRINDVKSIIDDLQIGR